MRFCFLDRITALRPGEAITAEKGVSYSEPFLADHFPGAPVLPGALMLEAAVEAAQWLLRSDRGFTAEDWRVVELRQAKFSRVVRPGEVLTVEVTLEPVEAPDKESLRRVRARGQVGAERAFSARFALAPRPAQPAACRLDRCASVRRAQEELFGVLGASLDAA